MVSITAHDGSSALSILIKVSKLRDPTGYNKVTYT